MKTDFNTKLSGLLRLLLPLSTSERVMEMLYDDSVSAEKVKEYVIKNLIRSNYNDFYRNFSPHQTDMFCEDADGLTRIVNEYMGINDKIL